MPRASTKRDITVKSLERMRVAEAWVAGYRAAKQDARRKAKT